MSRTFSWENLSRPLTVPSRVEPLINNIPVEILCKIFSDVLKFLGSPLGPSYLGPHRKNLALLKLTAVCRRWRLTASECAMLWTSIAFSTQDRTTVECATLFLGRSKEAMLSVHIWDPRNPRDLEIAQPYEELVKAIARQSHRLSTCELSSPSPGFWSHWSFPAPNLRKLTVQGHGGRISPIFRGQAPRLESITSFYYVPWPLGNYAALTQADLRDHGRHMSLTSLLDALRGCEMLEKLTLHGYAHLSRDTPPLATVSLPRLIKIDFFSSDSALILAHLETPSLTGPVIILDSSPNQDILRSLPSAQHSMPFLQGIMKLHVVLNAHSAQYSVAGYRGDGSIVLYIAVCGVEHWLRWAWVVASITAVATFAHFSSVHDLTLSTDNVVVPWDLWLPNLSHLRELTISCPRSEGLLICLLGDSLENGLPLCPSLQSLALYRCGRCAVVDHVGLMGLVISRYRAGRPLRKLKLHKDEWYWIQELDNSWVALAQSQCAYFR